MAVAGIFSAAATPVELTMNKVSTSMTLVSEQTGESVDVGQPAGTATKVYTFDAPAGRYLLTAFATDGTTVNGTIAIDIAEQTELQKLLLITCTVNATNQHADKTPWTVENGDYSIDLKLSTREGQLQESTIGKSVNDGRYTFLALEGHTYYLSLIPSAEHVAEGFTTCYRQGTLNFNVNISAPIPVAQDYTVTVPAAAQFDLGLKFAHFVDFTKVEPVRSVTEGETKRITYSLGLGQTYNFRTYMDGGLTQAGYFIFSEEKDKQPKLEFTEASYHAFDPHGIKHSVEANEGYETGDIFVNINPRNHLVLKPGESYDAHAMRTWQLTENSTNNYFMEPDFHYTVLDLDGNPSTSVVSVEQTPGSAWAKLKGVGAGEAIVLVTYDAIGLNYYPKGEKTPYMGGEYWGAIWPENTAAYVVTVGEEATGIRPNMTVNERYNQGALKLAGDNVDAEHDVFYYLDTEEGYSYTFRPEGVSSVTMARPSIGERMALYTGFGSEGVTANADGSYTLLLREGRQIVRLVDAAGRSVFQVLTAKKCHREIENVTRPGSHIFQPGDKARVQYSGLRHPANKLAGIYNMSAYVTYNGVPNGTSLILGAGQYTFGSVPSAQAVEVDIPADHDVTAQPRISMTEGVIQVNGYGDPIGNHRTISPQAGRSPNFTAVAHKTYFGSIPDVVIPLSPYRDFSIRVECDVEGAEITLSDASGRLTAGADGLYTGTYGTYTVEARHSGYRCLREEFTIGDDADGLQTFAVTLVPAAESCWDGKTLIEPMKDSAGRYLIASGAEMAWFASAVNGGEYTASGRLVGDIDLGDYDWTPAGTASRTAFAGTFSGEGHRIDGLYAVAPEGDYIGLFGYIQGTAASPAAITGVTVSGTVTGKRYAGGVAGYIGQYAALDTCANYASVRATGKFAGGVAGILSAKTSSVANCYNAGAVSCTDVHAGVVGAINAGCVDIRNIFNVGDVEDNATASACVGSTVDKEGIVNSFAVSACTVGGDCEAVGAERMASGEIAFRLGDAFGQLIGTDPFPTFGAPKVLYDAAADRYYNDGEESVDEITDTTAAAVMYYNAQGVASRRPFRGLNIVRYSDGTSRKIMIR